jgi:Bacterial nucleoid DNA-binding protein
MTRSKLIQKIAERYPQLTLADAELSVKNIIEAMSNSLASGGRVEVRGFGTFGLNHKPPRIGRNPKTGEKLRLQ